VRIFQFKLEFGVHENRQLSAENLTSNLLSAVSLTNWVLLDLNLGRLVICACELEILAVCRVSLGNPVLLTVNIHILNS
jgi:hypothetical protein